MLTLIATRNTFKLCNITMVNNKYKCIKLKKCFLTKTKVYSLLYTFPTLEDRLSQVDLVGDHFKMK